MFNNIEELRELIRQGKTNEEIINARLKYLEENNQSNIEPIFNGTQVYFYNGYIDSKTLISADGGDFESVTLYQADLVDLYNEIINTIRKNMDKGEIPLSIIIKKVRNYFSMSDESPYKELIELIKRAYSDEKNADRIYLPIILRYYNCSSYKGTITEFARFYLYDKKGTAETKHKYSKEIEEMKSSIDWHKLDENEPICRLSSLKGAGIALCTENSIAIQNCLAFLGFECYMLHGYLSDGVNEEEHNFNVVKTKNGEYKIVDALQNVIKTIEGITSHEDLLHLSEISATNGFGNAITYSSQSKKNKKHI